MSESESRPRTGPPIHNAVTGSALRSSKRVLGSTLQIGDVIEFPPGNYDPVLIAVVNEVRQDGFDILCDTGHAENGLDITKYYLLAGRACEARAEGIKAFAKALPSMREHLKDAKFHLEIFAAMAMSQPVPQNGFRFTWNNPHPGGAQIWHAEEGVFKIEKDPTKQNNPYTLTMTVKDGKTCSAGPFHSVDAAKEAADRIWNFMLQSQIHHSQVIGGGYLAVVSRVIFPNL
jgi:hypothetical protein